MVLKCVYRVTLIIYIKVCNILTGLSFTCHDPCTALRMKKESPMEPSEPTKLRNTALNSEFGKWKSDTL